MRSERTRNSKKEPESVCVAKDFNLLVNKANVPLRCEQDEEVF